MHRLAFISVTSVLDFVKSKSLRRGCQYIDTVAVFLYIMHRLAFIFVTSVLDFVKSKSLRRVYECIDTVAVFLDIMHRLAFISVTSDLRLCYCMRDQQYSYYSRRHDKYMVW
jgi:hypothetical protein